MLTTIFSLLSGSMPSVMVSQSPPVTVKTRPSVVSRSVAYPDCVIALLRSRPRGSQADSSRRSLVDPPLVRGRNFGALVLDGYAAERVVLPLGVALPVVRHEDPGQVGVAGEDDAEHVVRLPLLPAGGGVDAGHARHGAVDRHSHLEAYPAAVGHRGQLVDNVQPAGVAVQVVHTGHRR